MAFSAASNVSYTLYTQDNLTLPPTEAKLHPAFPLNCCQLCSCYYRRAVREMYTILLATASAASDSLPPTESQALVSLPRLNTHNI